MYLHGTANREESKKLVEIKIMVEEQVARNTHTEEKEIHAYAG